MDAAFGDLTLQGVQAVSKGGLPQHNPSQVVLSSSPTLFVKHSLKEPADQIRLGRLVKAGILKEGDELHYTRDFQGYDVQCLATIIDCTDKYHSTLQLDVSSTVSSLSTRTSTASTSSVRYFVDAVTGPKMLQASILDYHGVFVKPYPEQVWVSFNCYREGNHLGTLESLRQEYFQQRTAGDPDVMQTMAKWKKHQTALRASRKALKVVQAAGDVLAYTAARKEHKKALRRPRKAQAPRTKKTSSKPEA